MCSAMKLLLSWYIKIDLVRVCEVACMQSQEDAMLHMHSVPYHSVALLEFFVMLDA